MSMFTKAVVAGLFISFSATSVGSQSQPPETDAFTSENAILDTSVLFAIGAREARQELRGSFGWPTFQEGLVEGVYFRFDPDGYARFSSNARLDADVFEVICRPRTYSCMGRKGNLSFMLNTRGQLQLKLDTVAEGDRFFIVEGISELEVPARILQPLDDRMETLLSSSEELIIRRGQNEVDRISLVGFAAVSAYLRWISARQDYTVLPRGWPVPNSVNDGHSTNLTQVANWQSPMPQPQAIVPEAGQNVGAEVAEVRGELNILRELMLEKQKELGTAEPVEQSATALPQTASSPNDPNRIAELERNASALLAEIERLRGGTAPAPMPPAQQVIAPVQTAQLTPTQPVNPLPLGLAPQQVPAMNDAVPANLEEALTASEEAPSLAQRLEYLMTEIGLDAKTALMIVEMGSRSSDMAPEMAQSSTEQTLAETYQNQVMSDILQELQHKPEIEEPAVEPQTMPPQDYVLLSDYFRSVFEEPTQ